MDVLGSYHGILNPENRPNPVVKPDPKQKCFTQLRAIVRRLILRLHFICSVATWEAQTRVYILSGEKKKKSHRNCDPGEFLPG